MAFHRSYTVLKHARQLVNQSIRFAHSEELGVIGVPFAKGQVILSFIGIFPYDDTTVTSVVTIVFIL